MDRGEVRTQLQLFWKKGVMWGTQGVDGVGLLIIVVHHLPFASMICPTAV